jgi:hypothetical protein
VLGAKTWAGLRHSVARSADRELRTPVPHGRVDCYGPALATPLNTGNHLGTCEWFPARVS